MRRYQRGMRGVILAGFTLLFIMVPLSGDDPAILSQPTLAEAQEAGENVLPVDLKDPAVIKEGAALYSGNCTFYCHGKEGMAGRGPKLRGRRFDKEYLFNVLSNGWNVMPAFKGRLTDEQIWKLVAYILSLSGED